MAGYRLNHSVIVFTPTFLVILLCTSLKKSGRCTRPVCVRQPGDSSDRAAWAKRQPWPGQRAAAEAGLGGGRLPSSGRAVGHPQNPSWPWWRLLCWDPRASPPLGFCDVWWSFSSLRVWVPDCGLRGGVPSRPPTEASKVRSSGRADCGRQAGPTERRTPVGCDGCVRGADTATAPMGRVCPAFPELAWLLQCQLSRMRRIRVREPCCFVGLFTFRRGTGPVCPHNALGTTAGKYVDS